MNAETQALTSPRFWETLWSSSPVRSLQFDPRLGTFGWIHARLQKHLPRSEGLSLLEVGCYPGRFLWYFSRYFGYRVEGIDYIDWCCEKTGELLKAAGVEARVHQKDFLTWEPTEQERWDVVSSFGFVEHFEDYTAIVARHARLVRPGGFLVLEIPNHTGLYGGILKRMDHAAWLAHSHLELNQLRSAVAAVQNLELICAEGCGKFSLEHVCLLERSRRAGRIAHLAAHAFKLAAESTCRLLPESRSLNPYFLVLACKKQT